MPPQSSNVRRGPEGETQTATDLLTRLSDVREIRYGRFRQPMPRDNAMYRERHGRIDLRERDQ